MSMHQSLCGITGLALMFDNIILRLRSSVRFNDIVVFLYYIIITTIVRWNSNGLLLAVRWNYHGACQAFPVDYGCRFAHNPSEVRRKSPLDFVVQPKMLGQAPENHQKNTVVKKQKNMYSAYPQSDGVQSEFARKTSGSVKTSLHNLIVNFSSLCKSVWCIQGTFYLKLTYPTLLVVKENM